MARRLLGVDGFDGLHSRRHDNEVQFYAFDMLRGEDRKLPVSMRKTNLSRLLARHVDGIHLARFEEGEIGPELFRHACLMGLEGLVSKHRERAYRGGRCDHWVKGQEPETSSLQPRRRSVLRSARSARYSHSTKRRIRRLFRRSKARTTSCLSRTANSRPTASVGSPRAT